MTLGGRIQCQRKQLGLSQEKLAEMMNVSRQAVTKWESNQSVPSMKNLINLSVIFKIPLEQLVDGNNKEASEHEIQTTSAKDKKMNFIVNLTLIGFSLIAAAYRGYYQDRFFNRWSSSILTWICVGFLGGILIMIRDKMYYNKYQRFLIGYDLLFILPVAFIPMLPIRHDVALMLTLVYGVSFILIFIHKKLRPFKKAKQKSE